MAPRSLVVPLLLAGCLATARRDRAGDDAAVTAPGDAFFRQRGRDAANLDRARMAWLEALGSEPNDPALLSRLARAEWILSLTRPEEARLHLESGEELGWRCLLALPGFASATGVRGFQVTPEAVSTLQRDAVPCLAWTVANGLDLVALRGPGSALELEPLALLADRLYALSPGSESGVGYWAAARVRLLAPAPDDAALLLARADLERAVDAAPGFLVWRVDLAAAFPDARASALAVDLPEPDPFALENGAAAARLARATGEGP